MCGFFFWACLFLKGVVDGARKQGSNIVEFRLISVLISQDSWILGDLRASGHRMVAEYFTIPQRSAQSSRIIGYPAGYGLMVAVSCPPTIGCPPTTG